MNLSDLTQALGLTFHDPGLLQQALTHPSYVNEHPDEPVGSNQRLEFLGDAVIDLVVARMLYLRYPDMDEGALTDLRSNLVRGQALAVVSRRIGLGDRLVLGQGEAASGGRDRDSNLAAALEALVGAVLLDQGYRVVQGLVLRLLKPELGGTPAEAVPRDPKSELQELVQGRGGSGPRYQLVAEEGLPHQPSFTVQVLVGGEVVGTGQGRRKVDAERDAALQALKRLG